jgi:hypothetical protein
VSRPRATAAAAALAAALAAEQAACYGYGVVGAHLTGSRFAEASTDLVAHERARDALTSMIIASGGQPAPAAAAYELPIAVHSSADAVRLAVRIEHQVTSSYLAVVALAHPALRVFGAARMQEAAVRAARWSGRSQPFPGLPAGSLRPARG